MSVLLTGGRSATSQGIASILSSRSIPYILAARDESTLKNNSQSAPTTTFSFTDPSTFSNPFTTQSSASIPPIFSVYVIPPLDTQEPSPPINDFIDYAVEKHGVKRLVLMGGSSVSKGGPHIGKSWSYLEELREKGKDVEFAILQPTWFLENFTNPNWHGNSIRNDSKFYSTMANGRVPFIAMSDICSVAAQALSPSPSPSFSSSLLNQNIRILGAQLHTHDDVANAISNATGREVTFVKLSNEDGVKSYMGFGMPEGRARFMLWLENETDKGAEEKIWKEGREGGQKGMVERITGNEPVGLEQWVKEKAEKGEFGK